MTARVFSQPSEAERLAEVVLAAERAWRRVGGRAARRRLDHHEERLRRILCEPLPLLDGTPRFRLPGGGTTSYWSHARDCWVAAARVRRVLR